MQAPRELTLTRVWLFFLPLALSGLMMSVGQPIVHAGLARLERPELTLAAYGLTFYAAVLLEAPIIMLLSAANALVCDEVAYRRTRRWMILMNVGLTVNALLISSVTPLYDFIFISIMGFPGDVARTAQPGLIALILWPAVVGVRRYYQGILIRFGQTQTVGWGSGLRLVCMIGAIVTGVNYFPQHGIIVGSMALLLGALADCLVALWGARNLFRGGATLPAESADYLPASRDLPSFVRFYLPLALTASLFVVSRPLILSGIARSTNARLALAAWPVAAGSIHLLSGQLQMIQQAVVALVRDQQSYGVVRRFTRYAGLCVFALLVLLAVTPGADVYHRLFIGLEEPILSMTNRAFSLMVVIPLLMSPQAWFQGMLIRASRTMAVNLAALVNVVLVVSSVYFLAIFTEMGGHLLAAVLLPLALLTEVLLLRRWSRPVARALLETPRVGAAG